MKNKKYILELLLFSYPIAFGQLSQMLIGVGDVFVAARYSTNVLAAIGISLGITAPIFLIGFGLLFGISPILSEKRGQNKDVTSCFYTGVIYAIFISLIVGLINLILVYIIPYMGFDTALVPLMQDYVFICSFSFTGSFIFIAVKEYLQAIEHVFFANIVSVVAVFLNLFLAYVMTFGLINFPELGIKGLAYSSVIIRWLTGISVFIYAIVRYNKSRISFVFLYLKDVFKLGVPIALSIFTEVFAFSIIMILVGRLGAVSAAVHSIVLNISSVTYMIPLAVSSAVSVKVAYFYGAKNLKNIIDYSKAALFLSTCFMLSAAFFMFIMPKTILNFFTTDIQIINTGILIVIVCGLFQIFDGIQITVAGVLRGLGITKPTFFINLCAYWLLGLPLGYFLAYYKNLNVLGFWIGVASALLVMMMSLLFYLYYKILTLKKVIS